MRILAVSDYTEKELYEFFDKKNFPNIDIIFSCGDLPPEYLDFLVTVFNVPLYYVRGNHDLGYENANLGGCCNLDRKIIEEQGLRLMGLEGSRWYNGGPLQYTENEMSRRIKSLRFKLWLNKGVDIIITHAPPRHIHDAEDMCHRGFRCFRRLIDKYSPMFFFHGHIHLYGSRKNSRTTIIKNTKIVNTSGYQIIEINNGILQKH